MMQDDSCTILDDNNVSQVPITTREYEDILNIQREVLTLIAYETDTQAILNKVCLMAEALLPNSVASLMFIEADSGLLYVKAAPSIPQTGWDALNGIKPGPHSGSCGNAIYHKKPQYIINAFTDARGSEFLSTAKAFNLCSCWSIPVQNENNETFGSFALSSFEHRSPAPFHKKLLETASSIVTIVLKNEQLKEKMNRMIYEDALTALKNKVALQETLEEDTFCTLLFLDINNFSYINTAYGFEIGDKILISVSELFQSLCTADIYRLNVDQFAIKFDEKIDIVKMVEKIKTYFSTHTISVDTINLNISFTYGAVYSNQNLLKHAALAIKIAKERGKNRLHIFDNSLDSSLKREKFIKMNNELYSALETGSITPCFQGMYDNQTKQITKFEALVRLGTSNGELLSPFEFLDVAKLSGLLPKLTEAMIEKTFKIMSQNQYNFSINITEDDLSENYLLEYLLSKSREHNIAPYRVTLEILEGISATGQKTNIAQLKEMKRHGFQIAIDDFGAEYSNFERVLALDVDFLKIDAKYIKNIDKDKKSYEIVKSIVTFANNMYITTIAEFVHSKEVQNIVNDLGIKYSQGFYFSEPTQEVDTTPLNS